MNEKQQQLTFEKGITNVPSDLLCSDNALEESVGMIHDDGEHRVIQKPVVYVDTETPIVPIMEGFHLLYVHKFNDQERYIGYTFDDDIGHHANYMCYATKSGTTLTYRELEAPYTSDTKVTSVGNVLVVSNPNKQYRFLWKYEEYKIFDKIPDLQFDACIKYFFSGDNIQLELENVSCTGKSEGIIKKIGEFGTFVELEDYAQEDYNNLIVGLYSKNLKTIAHKKCFSKPFFVRTALQLYDDSYYYISNPILLFPSVTNSSYMGFIGVNGYLHTYYGHLFVKQLTDYTPFSDIVKDVVLFVSEGINIYDTTVDQETYNNPIGDNLSHDYVGVSPNSTDDISDYYTGSYTETRFRPLKRRDRKEIINDIKSTSLFYRVCSLGLNPVRSYVDVNSKIETHILDNLTVQEHIESDDYFSRSELYAQTIFSYNSRLNLANIKRGFFEGYDNFMPYDHRTGTYTYTYYVRIKTDEKDVWVKHVKETKQKQGCYFYYPDSRADHVIIYRDSTCILDEKLESHSGLNGVFYLAGLPGFDYREESEVTPSIDPSTLVDETATEFLPNYILQSEVNNPWVFLANGYFKVGTGKVVGMSSITQALSQGQYGAFPLLVFSESGIWALSVADTGYYSAIHPMSREVCNNPDSITQTDGAVFFSSEKGLMVVVGSDVKCVSEQLSGLESDFDGEVKMGNFRDYMKDCFIAYDYRDSLLWIFNNSRQQNQVYCYVYAIKSGTFGKYRFAQPIENVVNNYPDYLLQSGSTLFSLTGRQNINLDTSTYSGLIITRPMKLENGLALKSLMQVRHILQMKGRMTLRIYVSNNLNHWAEVHSLRGTPWKYYRFRFDFSDMKATDRFAGSMVITQERRTDKLL